MSERGLPYPLGATWTPGEGVNFSVWSRTATAVELLLFDEVDDARPARVIPLDRARNRSFSYWHVGVPEARPGQCYGWRVHGPRAPSHGLRHDPRALLLDPYGKAVAFPRAYDRWALGDLGAAMKSVVVDLASYDWEGDEPLGRPYAQTIIYEAHAKGFTAHPSSGLPPERRGTYRGLIDKIPYLVELGITAVELMPILAFDPQDAPPGRVNYWGYAPVSFFAPHPHYAMARDPQGVLDEVRDMVKALHRAGIEVILDVVGVEGPTDDPAIEAVRNRQVKNLLATTLIAMGVPMIGMGDEVRRTQRGNNNAYCQDNEISWFDWTHLEKHADVLRFTAGLCRLRRGLDMSQVDHGLALRDFLEHSRVTFHGVRLHEPDLADDSHSLALTVRAIGGSRLVHAILNAWIEPLDFELPVVERDRPWRRVVDTSLEGPDAIVALERAPSVTGPTYRAGPRSVVMLAADLKG